MSYKIEITAATTAELAGKLLALAAQMSDAPAPADPVMPEVKEAAKPKRAAKTGKEVETVVNTATGTGTTTGPVDEPQPLAQTDTVNEGAPATESAEVVPAAAEPQPNPAAKLDFDKDVTPVVLAAVKDKGREWVSGILSQFGVERASQVPDDRFGELVAMLKGDA